LKNLNLEKSLSEHQLSSFKDLFDSAEPSLRLQFTADKVEKKSSRAGGRPSLPAGFSWPLSRAKIPLAFLCQIDLSLFKNSKSFQGATALPDHGLLSFFYDAFDGPWGNHIDDAKGWRVFYFEDAAVLQVTDAPANLPPGSRFAPCAIAVSEELSYPAITVEMAATGSGGYETFDRYIAFAESLYGSSVVHRMFGHAQEISGDFKLDCEIASHDLELDDDFDFGSAHGCYFCSSTAMKKRK